jgi:iron(III) transport system ATP-binding protein
VTLVVSSSQGYDSAVTKAFTKATEYRGRGYGHVIGTGDAMLTSVFAVKARPRGSAMRLELDPSGCIAFPLADDRRYDGEVTMVTIDTVSVETN